MFSSQHARTILFAGAFPAALLLAACSGESDTAVGSAPATGSDSEVPVVETVPPADAPNAEKPAEDAVAGELEKPVFPPGHDSPAEDQEQDDFPSPANTVRPAGAEESPLLGNLTGPRLSSKVGADKHVFGQLMQGVVGEHTFELTSGGTESLIIKQVKPTCGCVVSQVLVEGGSGDFEAYTFGDPIPAGRRISFPAQLDTKKKTGHQNTRINIFSNDPRGTIQLGMEADITPFFTISPRTLNFGQASAGDVLTRKAIIQTAKATPVKLELFEQTLPAGASYELKPTNPDADGRAGRWEFSVTIGPDLVEGSLARSMMIKSDEPIPGAEPKPDGTVDIYHVTVPMNALVVGPFSHSPAYLSMGLLRPGQTQSRTLTVECHDEEFSFATSTPKVRVVGAAVPGTDEFGEWEYSDLFTPTVRPVDGKNAVDIELRMEGMAAGSKGSFRGTLVIDLDHPEKKRITVVITGLCRG